MVWKRILLPVPLLAVTASVALAQGAVSLNWNSCTGPLDLAVTPGMSAVIAYASVLGQSSVAQGFSCVIAGREANGPMRDAWRFDPTGCEGGAFMIIWPVATAAIAKTCPSFNGALESQQSKAFSFDPVTGTVRMSITDLYPNNGRGNPGAVNPAQRYHLAYFNFNLSYAVNGPGNPILTTCGGLEVPTCWSLASASWIDLAGVVHPWTVASGYFTTNDPNNRQNCPLGAGVPAASPTWGRIKSQYRD